MPGADIRLVIAPVLTAEVRAIFFTKVVTQFIQFLSDNRVGDSLDAHVDLNDLDTEEEHGFELAEVK